MTPGPSPTPADLLATSRGPLAPAPDSPSVADFDLPTFREAMTRRGWKLGRADVLLRTLYLCEPVSPERFGVKVAAWAAALPLGPLEVVAQHDSADGTSKLLVRTLTPSLRPTTIECVLMPGELPGEFAGCVSSQAGCAMGCDFCASTLAGVERDLTAAEIVGQFLLLRRLARQRSGRLNTVVFMGMGEPMLNLAAVVPAVRRIADPTCGQLGFKNVQVSTVGIVPGIRALAETGMRVQLALSLHGGDDETRRAIVPAGRKYTVADTLDAAWAFQETTGRVSNIEYCLLAGVNDQPEQAHKLATAIAGRRMHVNLIPHNPIGPGLSGRHYAAPSPESVATFLQILRNAFISAHVRKTRGQDQSAACGQLRRTTLPVLPVLTA